LRKVGARLESVAGATADAYRLGGDEFAIVIVGTAEIERVIESIPNLFRNPIRLEGGESVQMTGSVGVARAPEDVMNAQDLLKAADMALYEAKRRGRNQVVSYSAALRHKVNAMTHTIDVASRPARPLVGEIVCGQSGRLFARRAGDNLRPLTARLSPATIDRSPSNEDPAVTGKPKLQDTA
ncbi:MAG: GGDEF domain-containing protein, partial [Geminicoccaceae bacterium]|nr:GGDEF domain-containing protein [Geminicoccaceae bacterium]